jgi:integrase
MMLTDVLLRQAKAEDGRRLELWDSKVTGLVFRVSETGAKSWSLLYRAAGVRRRLTLGDYKADGSADDGLTLAEARAAARAALRAVARGEDPAAAKARARAEALRAGATFGDLAESWLASPAAAAWKPKTTAEFTRLVRVELIPVLGDLRPEAVTKAHVRGLYDRIAERSESIAQHTLAVLRLFYRWAEDEDHVDVVPSFPRRGTQSNRRDRVLEDHELRAVLAALDTGAGGALGEAFRLLLLTAQRRGEVLSMRWSDVTEEADGAWWTIPPERAKGGRAQRVPLTAPAVEALARQHSVTGDGDYVFPGPRGAAGKVAWCANPQKAAARLWRACGLKGDAHIHDLRRTAATGMARLGVARLTISKVLGHADRDVTGRYDVHAYDREKRVALSKWGDELERIVRSAQEPARAKVLPWARR